MTERGKRYLFWTATHAWAGNLREETSLDYEIDHAVQVFESGNFEETLKTEAWKASETYPPSVIVRINRGAVVAVIDLPDKRSKK